MVSAFSGKKYQLDLGSSVNFDAYMKACGVGDKGRELGGSTAVTFVLTVNGDTYTIEHLSTVKNLSDTFKLGQEVAQKTADGRDVMATYTVDGNKLTEVQKGDKTVTITREFSATEMKTKMTVDDVVASRVYKAV